MIGQTASGSSGRGAHALPEFPDGDPRTAPVGHPGAPRPGARVGGSHRAGGAAVEASATTEAVVPSPRAVSAPQRRPADLPAAPAHPGRPTAARVAAPVVAEPVAGRATAMALSGCALGTVVVLVWVVAGGVDWTASGGSPLAPVLAGLALLAVTGAALHLGWSSRPLGARRAIGPPRALRGS